jgi:hypothetical protein
MLEHEYERLDKQHPHALWILTHSANFTQWFESLQHHFSYHDIPRNLAEMKDLHTRCHIDMSILDDFPKGQGRALNVSDFIHRHKQVYQAFNDNYNEGLFRYFGKQRTVIVDVQAGNGYDKLALIARNGTARIDINKKFPHANSKLMLEAGQGACNKWKPRTMNIMCQKLLLPSQTCDERSN